jgi:hypothetical protein
MSNERILNNEKKLSELVEKIMKAKAQFNNNAVLNVFSSENIINNESKLLAEYAYELEKLTLIKVLFEKGFEEIADDFNISASFTKHKDNIINENINLVQQECKLYGKHVDVLFNEISTFNSSSVFVYYYAQYFSNRSF